MITIKLENIEFTEMYNLLQNLPHIYARFDSELCQITMKFADLFFLGEAGRLPFDYKKVEFISK